MTRPDLVERNRSHRTSFLYESAEWMHDAYVIRRLTLREIAAEVDCALRTVARWMLIHGIETRSSWARPTGELTTPGRAVRGHAHPAADR